MRNVLVHNSILALKVMLVLKAILALKVMLVLKAILALKVMLVLKAILVLEVPISNCSRTYQHLNKRATSSANHLSLS